MKKYKIVTRSFGFVDNTVLIKDFTDKDMVINEAKKILNNNREVTAVSIEYFNESENMFFPLIRIQK